MIKIHIIRKSNKKVGKRVNPTIYKHEYRLAMFSKKSKDALYKSADII